MAFRKAAVRPLTIPATMHAAAIDRFGKPGVISLRTLPAPQAGPNEVLIAMHATGVGVWDAEVREGIWQPFGRPKFPLVLGTDGAGIVAAKGARVRRFAVGDRVWAYDYANAKGGFYAEYVAVNTEHVGHVPPPLDLIDAGAAAVTSLTALQGIDEQLRLRQGETLLIFGAAGAVGTLAIQFAKRKRATVLAVVRGRDAVRLVRRLGADAAIDAKHSGAADQLRVLARGGFDAALAFAGGDLLEQCLDLIRPGGRVAYPNGVDPEPRRRRGIRVHAYDAGATPAEFERLAHAVVEAKLRVPIAAIYPLAQATEAHKRLEQGHLLGRIVLRVRRGTG
jgi:NADPH:quinone reductase